MSVHTAVTVAGVVLAVNAAIVAALALAAWVGRRRERRFDAHAAEAVELTDDTDDRDLDDPEWTTTDEQTYRKLTRWDRGDREK